MAEDDKTRVEIGFGLGQVLSVKLTVAELAELREKVVAGSGWADLKTQDGTIALNVATVVFVRVDDASHSIGFSG
jgi:hypothetical protein